MEQSLQLQKSLEEQNTATTSWIEALTAVVLTNQNMAKSLTRGLQLILKASRTDGGYIHLLDQEKHVLRLRACLGLTKKAEDDLRIVREREKVPGQVLHEAEALIATNSNEISDLSGKVTQEKKRMLHAGFPLKWNGRVLGTLTVVSKNRQAFSEGDVAILKAFSQFLAVVVQNHHLLDIVSHGKRQWENAIDLISDLVVICDRDFRIVKTNKAIFDRFWLPLEDALGKECFELLYDGIPFSASRENLEKMLKKGVTYIEEIAPSRWGGVFSIVVSPILTFGRLVGSIHVIKEITHEKFLERDREELSRSVSLFAPGTVTIDPEGRIRSWNSGASEILGYKEEEIKGKPFSMILSSPESETLLDRLKESGGILDFDTVAIAKGKRPIQVSITLSAHRDQEERLEETTVFIRDISQREEDKMRLVQSARLAATMETAASLSRKLGEKLEKMVAQIDEIEDGIPQPQQITTRLKQVAVHARSVLEILHRVRQSSEIRPEGKLRLLDSARLIQGIVEMIEREWSGLFRTRGIDFVINPDQRTLPTTRGDFQKLLEAFGHLIRNSVEAMPNGGKLILRTRTDRKWVILVLIDHGVGMTIEEINRAFDPFFTTHSQNLGLGLSIVHGIIRRHHGEVRLQSTPGQGTHVTVKLPALTEESNNSLLSSSNSLS